MSNVNLELFGRDPKVTKVVQTANNLAVTKAPVLIVGEQGVGKRMLARYVHERSSRANKGIEFVDCAENPQNVENAILGHRDEESSRFVKGALEKANGGTVVFCNVDSLDETLQKRLHQIFSELGDYDIDVRIVCTTTKNLSKLVGSGRFYRGFYTFIAGNQLFIPPLRERQEDLQLIINHYFSKHSGQEIKFTDDAMNRLLKHYWASNLTEVSDVSLKTLKDLEGTLVTEDDLSISEKRSTLTTQEENREDINLMSLKDAERLLIQKALVHTSENRTQAAKILGVSIRTLRNKINEYRTEGAPYFMGLR